MIKVEHIETWGFEHAIRGMRNPKNSWDKSDSGVCGDFSVEYKDGQIGCDHKCPKWSPDNYCGYSERLQKFPYDYYMIGENDLDLMKRLYKAGTEHRKYLRQIFVSMDITAPLYWWKEMDQYRINVTTNSCSTMHKIHAKEFAIEDFSTEHLETLARFDEDGEMHKPYMVLKVVIDCLNACRNSYLQTKNKTDWWQMIQLLPSSYNQKRTVTFTYENVVSMIRQRTGHKLDEWNQFVEILRRLPYIAEIIDE